MGIGVAVLGAAPLLVCGPRVLVGEYASWGRLVRWDSAAHGWSVMSVLRDAAIPGSGLPVQLAAVAVLGAPLALGIRFGTDATWRRTFASSVLVFAVLFNHRAEYASFVLSAVGLGVWCATARNSTVKAVLVALALVAPGPFLSRPDARVTGALAFLGAHRLFHPMRVVPLFLVWCWMTAELLGRFVDVRVSVQLRGNLGSLGSLGARLPSGEAHGG
jgi:hypothetical protein